MKNLLYLIILPVFLGGTSVPPSGVSEHCFCLEDATIDTVIPIDTIVATATQTVDSFKQLKLKKLDSLHVLRDSLLLDLFKLKMKKFRKLSLDHVDSFPLAPTPKHPLGGMQYKYWYYWHYPNGDIRYDDKHSRTEKIFY